MLQSRLHMSLPHWRVLSNQVRHNRGIVTRETVPVKLPLGATATSPNVRFGSLADICNAKRHVRFTPNSDRESGPPQNAMSALPPESGHAATPTAIRLSI